MNLPVILTNIAKGAKALLGTTKLLACKHSDKIFIGAGLIGMGVTVVETVKATNKTNDILQDKEDKALVIKREVEHNDAYTENMQIADTKKLNRKTRIALVKTWLPVAGTFVASVIFIGKGYCIINGRYVAVASAYEGLEAFTRRYRDNVINEFGKDVDWRMAHDLKAEELAEIRREKEQLKLEDDKKKPKKEPKTAYNQFSNNQIFDCHSERWRRNWVPYQVIDHVQMIESKLQDKLEMDGHVFLNDAYEMLGLKKTSQGQLLGWINTPRNKHNERGRFLSLGYANDETPEEEIRRILASPSNDETWMWISPNCDGVIYQLIDTPFSER